MASFIREGNLDFLSDKQKAKLSRHFIRASTTTMPHQLAVDLGLEYSEALAILTVLEAEGLCEMSLLIYHNCDPGVPAGEIPFGQGFPDLPWDCQLCEKTVENEDELSFDFIAYFNQTIEFV